MIRMLWAALALCLLAVAAGIGWAFHEAMTPTVPDLPVDDEEQELLDWLVQHWNGPPTDLSGLDGD